MQHQMVRLQHELQELRDKLIVTTKYFSAYISDHVLPLYDVNCYKYKYSISQCSLNIEGAVVPLSM